METGLQNLVAQIGLWTRTGTPKTMTPYGGAFGLWTFFHFLSNKINKNMFHGTSCVVFSEPAILFGGSDLVSSTNGPPSCIYLNKPVARDPLTFRPPLVARDARAPRLLCDPISQEPITTQDLGSCDRFRPITTQHANEAKFPRWAHITTNRNYLMLLRMRCFVYFRSGRILFAMKSCVYVYLAVVQIFTAANASEIIHKTRSSI